MPILIEQNDITKVTCDAIVNAANETLLGGGGVDGAIHRAAGPGLREYCRTLGGCPTGQARISPGFNLKSSWIIHTVGPVWQGGGQGECELLASCYRNSLTLAQEKGLKTVAFPLISAGAYGFPPRRALRIAIETIRQFLGSSEMEVRLILYNYDVSFYDEELRQKISSYIKQFLGPTDVVMEPQVREASHNYGTPLSDARPPQSMGFAYHGKPSSPPMLKSMALLRVKPESTPLASVLDNLEESFTQRLVALVRQTGLPDAEVYKRAYIDRRLYSKIRNDPQYHPGKPTVLAFCIALELDVPTAESFLGTAGYALSNSSVTDIIVRYHLENKNYSIMEVNEALISFDQPLLAS